jgi:GNAT superfamily N-acetyltransferase
VSRPLPSGLAFVVLAHRPGVTLDVSLLPGDGAHLSIRLIRTDPDLLGQGRAEFALRDLLAACDAQSLIASLTPEPLTGDRRTSRPRLVRWYTRHGFVRNCWPNRDFETRDDYVRTPR